MAKFRQNGHLRQLLFETQGTTRTTLVEASPEDPIWGIGLEEGHPNCYSRETWQGMKWLGEILTEVREVLLMEE